MLGHYSKHFIQTAFQMWYFWRLDPSTRPCKLTSKWLAPISPHSFTGLSQPPKAQYTVTEVSHLIFQTNCYVSFDFHLYFVLFSITHEELQSMRTPRWRNKQKEQTPISTLKHWAVNGLETTSVLYSKQSLSSHQQVLISQEHCVDSEVWGQPQRWDFFPRKCAFGPRP